MVAGIALAIASLRIGLSLRRARAARRPPPRDGRRRHLRLARPAVWLLLSGALLGLCSALWLRGWDPLHSLHGWLGLTAAALFAATAVLGHRLEHGRADARGAHAAAALLGVLVAAVAAVAGFVLLP